MRTYEVVRGVKTELHSVSCDRCGRAAWPFDADDIVELQEFLYVCFTGGYGSVFGDGARMEVDLCQHCVKELLGPYLRVEARPI